MPTRRSLLTGIALSTTALAGCLGDGTGESDTTSTTTGTTTTTSSGESTTTASGMATGPTVTVAETDLGEVLADAEGVTLYLFTRDSDGESVCYDGCAENWPPLTVDGDPTAGDGVTADLGTHERDDGATQVTANGWPLYYYAGDSAPGDTNGQGVGDVWYVLAPDGTQMGGDTTTTASGGGGGGGDGGGDDDDGGRY